MIRVGRAVLRERAGQRGLLLFVGVLLLLAIELDQHLAGLHSIAEVREDLAHRAVRFRGNGDLVHRGQRADDVHGTADAVFRDDGRGDALGRAFARLGVGGVGSPAAGGAGSHGKDEEDGE